MKYLIAGLGNIGEEYFNTRHNIGFAVLDAFAKASNISFKSDRLAFVTEYKFKNRILVLIKPTTYMNLSGKAVNYWLQKEHIPVENLFVIVDDIALPFGTIRIRGKGSNGGHNGLTDIENFLKTSEYARLRFGIGSNFSKGKQVNYVLGQWNNEETALLPEKMNKVIEAIQSFATIGLEKTMNLFNG